MVLVDCEKWTGKRIVGYLLALFLLGAVMPIGSQSVAAEDPLGVGPAAQFVRTGAESINQTFAQLPPPTQAMLAGQVQILVQTVTDTLNRIEEQTVPVVSPLLIHDLEYLADILYSFDVELAELAQPKSGQLNPETAARIDGLLAAAAAQVARLDAAVDRWIERTQQAVVEVEHDDGEIVVRSIDRSVYGVIRYTALTLLLVGLLAIGLQLLHMAAYRIDRRELLQGRTVVALTSLAVLGVFFLAALVLAIFPGTLAALSARIEVQRPEHPCRSLQLQRDHLAAAQAIADAYLIEGTKRRMEHAAKDCLGLPEEEVAMAVERLAGSINAGSVPPDVAEAAVDVRPEPAPEAEIPAPPVVDEHDVLAELLAAIRNTDAAPGDEDGQPQNAGEGPPLEDGRPVTPAPPAGPQPFITTDVVNYREGPSTDAPRLGTLISGARVDVLRQEGGWAEIRLSDGREVYVASEFLEPAS